MGVLLCDSVEKVVKETRFVMSKYDLSAKLHAVINYRWTMNYFPSNRNGFVYNTTPRSLLRDPVGGLLLTYQILSATLFDVVK